MIRELPDQKPRVETGPVQFGKDWPGVFIRGDHAGWYALQLKMLLGGNGDEMSRMAVESLQEALAGAVVGPARGQCK